MPIGLMIVRAGLLGLTGAAGSPGVGGAAADGMEAAAVPEVAADGVAVVVGMLRAGVGAPAAGGVPGVAVTGAMDGQG